MDTNPKDKITVERGHLETVMPQGTDQQTLADVLRDDRRPGITALQRCFTSIQQQSAFNALRFRRVAPVTMLQKHRPNILFEEFNTGCIDRLLNQILRE